VNFEVLKLWISQKDQKEDLEPVANAPRNFRAIKRLGIVRNAGTSLRVSSRRSHPNTWSPI